MDADQSADPRDLDHPDDGRSRAIDELVAKVRAIDPALGRRPVSGLNPEAGQHAITTDPRELRAALRAGDRTWRRFPYLEQRYGERGRRFTGSDSAWIVTLADGPPAEAERQLRWLGTLLASRGMPRWLLEAHLETLHAELVREVPEKLAAYDALLAGVAMLRGERLASFDEATFAALADNFSRLAGPTASARLPESGALVAAAVADERAGIARAVPSLVEWLADPVRFPAAWTVAVARSVEAARASAGHAR